MEKIKTYLNNNIKCILIELDSQNSDYKLTKVGNIWYIDNGLKKEGIILEGDLEGDSIEYVGILEDISEGKLETMLKNKDNNGVKIWYDYQRSGYNPELKVKDSFKTFLDKNAIVWPDSWGLITITRNKNSESLINEDDGGGGACATQGSVGGMGDVVAAQPGAIPGTTGTTGSGDVGFPFPYTGGRTWVGPNPSMMGKKKRKNNNFMSPKKGGIKIEKPKTGKVMSFNDFYKSTVNDVTHVKENNIIKKVLFTIPFLISLNIVKAQSIYKKEFNQILDRLPSENIQFLNNKFDDFKNKVIDLSKKDLSIIDDIKVTLYNIAKNEFPQFTAIIPLNKNLDVIAAKNPFTGNSVGIRKRF